MAKLGRAKKHLKDLRDELAGDLPNGFRTYPVTAQVHREGLEYRFHVGEIPSFDADAERIALVFGDFLFNLRATLDQVVYELHVRHFRGHVPDGVEERTQFPIYSKRLTASDGRKKGQPIPTNKWGSIKSLSARQRTAIEWLQPYNRRNDDLFWARDGLESLAVLNNIDKHRRLHIAQVAIAAVVGHQFPPSTGFQNEIHWGPLVSNAKVYTWTFTSPPDDIASRVNMNHQVTTGVRIYERGEPVEVLALAEHLLHQVEDRVIPRLAPALR